MIYAYRCRKCGAEFTVRAALAEKERGLDLTCPGCGEKDDVVQDLRGVGMVFGGLGSRGGAALPGCDPRAGCC